MGIYAELPDDQFDFDRDWKESSESHRKAGGPDVFTRDSSEATIVGEFEARKRRDALAKFVGYSVADTGSPYKLRRTVPPRHPTYPWLRCTGCSFELDSPAPQAKPSSGYWPKQDALDPTQPFKHTTAYQRCVATLKFSPLPYTVFTDAENEAENGGAERLRFTAFFESTDPILELLMVDSEPFLRFTEGPGEDTKFGGTLAEYLQQCDLVMLWAGVEETYLTGTDGYIPKRLLHHMGSVNDSTFLSFVAGTLRMNPPRLKRYQQPVWTGDAYGSWAYDVWIGFRYTDPPLKYVGGGGERKRGHRVFPWSRSGDWYHAVRDVGDGPYFRETDFGDMFEHADNPAFPIPTNPPTP